MRYLLSTCLILLPFGAVADEYDVYRVECGPEQISAIGDAVEKARELAARAASVLPPDNSETGAHFRRWFGGPEGDSDPVLIDLYADLQTRMIFTSYWCPPPANFPGDERHPNVFAWVPSDAQTEIFLEQRFFEAPTTGEDSRAGTILHELSHNSTVEEIRDTDVDGDGEKDYGVDNAQKLAGKWPGIARRTADNIQYFTEDVFWGI